MRHHFNDDPKMFTVQATKLSIQLMYLMHLPYTVIKLLSLELKYRRRGKECKSTEGEGESGKAQKERERVLKHRRRGRER